MSLRPLLAVGWLLLLLGPALVGCVVLALRTGPRARWLVRAGAVLVVLVMGLGPAVPAESEEAGGVAVDMFFVVDRTGSMAAEDWGDEQPRLDGVRGDVPALVDALPGARYSIIGWSSEATRQLPLTTDADAVRAWSQTVRQEITAYSQGSLLDRPLPALSDALEGAAERNPSHVRLVYFLSDGEQTTPGTRASYAHLDPLVDGGAVLGYGTPEGGPMRSYDGSLDPDPEAPYIWDTERFELGETVPAISVPDEGDLRRLASELGVPYVHRVEGEDVTRLVSEVDVEHLASDGRRGAPVMKVVVWPLALALAALLALEAWWTASGWASLRRPGASS
ncbi:MAG: hypothetical protein JWP95_1807 [Actinotalea sp.]|nr:hypothetical protein [Actinotalea sp.]